MSTIRFDDNRGGLAYPFLCVPANDATEWQITSRPFANDEALAQIFEADTPTPSTGSELALNAMKGQATSTGSGHALRWVKDNKVLDLHIPGQDTTRFLADSGLRLSMAKGGYVLSKRLSRIMRPYRYYGFFGQDEVTIDYNELLDGRLWDGSGLVSRGFIQRLADSLDLTDQQRHELLHSNRFEVTTLHNGGQDKGHVYVVDDLSTGSRQGLAVDFMFPAGSAKQELALSGRIFVGLHPVHSDDQMCLDVQSLINLTPFFQPEQLLAWSQMESEMFLRGIADGRLAGILGRLYEVDVADGLATGTATTVAALADWHVGEYLASGGSLMWFSGMVKAVAKQHLNRLGSRIEKLRLPIPGGRYYIFPAAVGKRDVPPGQVELDPDSATAWVNDQDWLNYIVDVLGGCDGDDAVWVMPFTDRSDGGKQKLLLWRSPNQLGEYILLQPTERSHTIAWETAFGSLSYPLMESRLLPPRIDSVRYQYGSLAKTGDQSTQATGYTISALQPTILRAFANRGLLGGYVNVMMICQALYGRLPAQLPATLEDVIDGSVKTGLDLTPVRRWSQMALRQMVRHGRRNPERGMPQALLERLPPWLQEQAQVADSGSNPHWLDTLVTAIENHKAAYWADVEALAMDACPPLELFEQGREWLAVGKELRRVYGQAIRQAAANLDHDPHLTDDERQEAIFNAARRASEGYLAQWDEQRSQALVGAAAYLYVHGPDSEGAVRDGLLWQLGRPQGSGRGRERGIAHQMIAALRQIGLLGAPTWTREGVVLYYKETPTARPAGVPVRINGTWANWLAARNGRSYERLSDIPAHERESSKARIADFVQNRFRGMVLTTEVTDNNRVITRTPHGNLFGYVQRDHELYAIRHDRWRIAWAHAIDGNVLAILEPA